MLYRITYRVTEQSTFEALLHADTEDQAMADFREDGEAMGYTKAGSWKSTEDSVVDLDSIRIEEVIEWKEAGTP